MFWPKFPGTLLYLRKLEFQRKRRVPGNHHRPPKAFLRKGKAKAGARVEKAKEKQRGEVEEAGTSLTTLCPPEPSSSFLSQRVKAAIEKPAGGFAKNSSLRSRN